MKRGLFTFALLIVFSLSLFAYAEDSEYGRIVGDRKYFVENPAIGGGRDYIVRNPRATLLRQAQDGERSRTVSPPAGIPLAKMDSTQEECGLWRQDTEVAHFGAPGFQPKIAAVGDTIHIVWWQRVSLRTPHEEVFYARSTDGGKTWSDSIALSDVDDSISTSPHIVAYDNYAHVFWANYGTGADRIIYYRRSTDAGDSWLPKQVIKKSVFGISPGGQRTTAKDGILYLTYSWGDEYGADMRLRRSTDHGETWEEENIMDSVCMLAPRDLASNSGGLHMVGQGSYGEAYEIFYYRSTDFGETWTSCVPISHLDDIHSQWPAISADDSGGVYATWFDYKYSPYGWTGDIFLRRSTDNGETWEPIISLTDDPRGIGSDVCADSFGVHVVWHDQRHSDSSNSEIYYRKSSDGGVSWLPEERLTAALGRSDDPTITTSLCNVHVAWIDSRDLSYQDIYYKKHESYIPGDANGDRDINVSDVVYLINYLFIGGPAPKILESGDPNTDDEINVADIVYLVNYLFIGGPEPAGC
jgi:hypothetical protein